jgi:hypothetical protein
MSHNIEAIAKIVAEAGGADKDCCHVEKFPCWMNNVEGMYCACIEAANKISNLINGISEKPVDPDVVYHRGVIGYIRDENDE